MIKNKLKLKNSDVGRWANIKFYDVGLREALIVEFDENYKEFVTVFEVGGPCQEVCVDQVISVGERLTRYPISKI